MKNDRRTTSTTPAASSDFARPWLLASLAAVCVARPLLASEGASYLGDGQPFVMLYLALAGFCCLLALARGGLPRPLTLADGCVLVLVAAMVASCMAGAGLFGKTDVGTPRSAVNMLFEWVGFGLIYFLTRQLVQTQQESRALVAAMFGLAVVLAAFGFYQVTVTLPADRAAYVANPDKVLMESVGQVFAPDSPERLRFEYRLRSNEPLATFALTNSLAGFLAPWLVMALGVGLAMWTQWNSHSAQIGADRSLRSTMRGVGLVVCILAIVICLGLTKSRSAYLAVLVGVLLLPLASSPRSPSFKRNWALAVGGVLALSIIGVVALQGLHGPLLSAAWHSLGYRFEYWQSTLSMISDYPLLGVGSGNFQDFYTQFKLPQASEEVRDPHNFLLEVWATGGTLALGALVAMLSLLAWRANSTPVVAQQPDETPNAASKSAKWILGGAVAGFVLAFLVGPLVGLTFFEEQLVAGLVIQAIVLALAWRWVVEGTLPTHLPALALLVLAINLLAAGGISYPGVAGSFWLLAALALNQFTGEPATSSAPPGRWPILVPAVGMAACTMLAVACYLSAYQPVLAAREAMIKAELARSPESKIEWLEQAGAADPLAAEPWIQIAELDLARLKKNPTDVNLHNHFTAATANLFSRRPHSSSAFRQAGHWYNQLYAANKDPEAAAASLKCFRYATKLYPKHPTLRAEFALGLREAGELASARRNAAEALRLDEQTPHADLKLPDTLRIELKKFVATPITPASENSANEKSATSDKSRDAKDKNNKPQSDEATSDKPVNGNDSAPRTEQLKSSTAEPR